MTGSTPRFNWPYPVPTDLIANGASTIGQLAQAIESQISVPDNQFGASELLGSYPVGWSIMTVLSPASAGGWPAPNTGGAIVLTFRGAGLGFQFYLSSAALPYGFLMRFLGSSSANPWVPVNGIIPADTFSAAELGASYPPGNSSMAVSSGNYAALGWPIGAGNLTTYRNSTGSVCAQFYMIGTTAPQLLFRWNGLVQSAWQTVWGVGVPTAWATGGVANATITPNTNNAIPVTFPAGRLTGIPRVMISLINANPQNWFLSVNSPTTSGFTAQIFHPTATTVSFHWTVTQGAT